MGVGAFNSARRQNDHAMTTLTAKRLLETEGGDIQLVPRQVHRKTGRRGITDRQASPVIGNPVAIRHAHARCSAIPCKDHIMIEIHLRQVRQGTVSGFMPHQRFNFQLIGSIGDPALAKGLPAQNINAARPQQ